MVRQWLFVSVKVVSVLVVVVVFFFRFYRRFLVFYSTTNGCRFGASQFVRVFCFRQFKKYQQVGKMKVNEKRVSSKVTFFFHAAPPVSVVNVCVF